MIEKFVRVLDRGRWYLLALWLAVLAVAAVVGWPLKDQLSGGGWEVRGSQAQHVLDAERSGFLGRGSTTLTAVVHDDRFGKDAPQFAERARRVFDDLQREPDLKITSRYGWSTLPAPPRDRFVGSDGRTAVESVALDLDDGTARRILPDIQKRIADRFRGEGLRVSLVGGSSFWGEINKLSAKGLARAELVTLPLILVILLLLFRSVVASIVSLSVGVTAVAVTFAVLAVLSRHFELSIFVQNAATMLGLGIGIDYSLFMVSRFREELSGGATVRDALATTLHRAGETVVASGLTVAVAMAALFLVDLTVIRSIALGAIVVVVMSVLSSIFVLPVLLCLVGRRINAGTLRLSRRSAGTAGVGADSRWARYAGNVMRRPVPFLLAGVAVLVVAGSPALRLQTFTPDARIVPDSSPVRQGYDYVQRQFGVGYPAPLRMLVESDVALDRRTDTDRIVDLAARLGRLQNVDHVSSPLDVLRQASPARPFAALTPTQFARLPQPVQQSVRYFVSEDRRKLIVEVVPTGPAAAPQTGALLASLRGEAAGISRDGLRASVGGETATGVDSNDVIQDNLLAVVLVMLASMYLLLLVTFRSIFLPLQAIVINLLSVAATYGILVALFQWGWASSLLGLQSTGYVQNFVPVLLLALLFSLSTDYMVFLLNRVREYDRTGMSNHDSVVAGVAATGPLITGAATLMVAVFGAFAFASIMPITQLGVGMAVAIALDATVVRLVVVPAVMRLMGRLNWWLPGRRVPAGQYPGEDVESRVQVRI